MSREKGNIAEGRASKFLYERGYTIVERNVYSRFGEIDIVALKDDTLHFIEVKSAEEYELAIQNITPKKLSRIIKTAEVYMSKNSFDADFTFDAVLVMPQEIEMLENITL